MKLDELRIENVVIGSGAAGFQTALRLKQNGEEDLVLLTENVMSGTSRNTGSDKQTYYKLSIAGGDMDSVKAMAEDLFAGQCVDGDQALCEAALSIRSFYRLVELGVPFPYNEYGEYMGYKTDHDRGRRATSAGPYTSKLMTECLEREAARQKIRIMNQVQAIKLLVKDKKIKGILCLDKKKTLALAEPCYLLIWCRNAILATGGPAGLYHDSVYPTSQIGSSGIAFLAGVKGKNLTEWQFGMASLNPRWNVSGTYMQVLPKVVSTDREGNDEKEFLLEYFDQPGEMLSQIFMKGYQWPFDVSKIFGGSSIIDLLIYRETIMRGRRVFLDYRSNTGNAPVPFEKMTEEAYAYLKNAGALFGTPIERLKKMNEPAISFYKDHNVDLYTEKLEIAICAQHNNGGLSTDGYWQTDIEGLFAVGEVCGSHGVTRPGGSALNAGQCGAVRATEKIHLDAIHGYDRKASKIEESANSEVAAEGESTLKAEAVSFARKADTVCGSVSLNEAWLKASKRMSACGGMIRDKEQIRKALEEAKEEFCNFASYVEKPSCSQLPMYYHLYDMLVSQIVYLSAMLDYAQSGAGSRGSALYTNENGQIPDESLPSCYRCLLDNRAHGHLVQEISFTDGECTATWRPVRPIPDPDYFFENQWKAYRDRLNIR